MQVMVLILCWRWSWFFVSTLKTLYTDHAHRTCWFLFVMVNVMQSKSFGLEEGFELQGWCDDVDVTGGPAKSRVEHTKQRLPLFAGWSFYIHGSQPGAGQDEIIELLKSTGATVLDVLPQEMQPRTAVLVSGEWNNESLSPVDTLDISFVFDSITTYDIRDIDGYRVVSTGDDEEVGTPSLF
eukprot:m.292810 g.292810  ORF g.292810 m.292810 type:complete len:182 (+) comp20010_c0_seq4:3609-4154(+)